MTDQIETSTEGDGWRTAPMSPYGSQNGGNENRSAVKVDDLATPHSQSTTCDRSNGGKRLPQRWLPRLLAEAKTMGDWGRLCGQAINKPQRASWTEDL